MAGHKTLLINGMKVVNAKKGMEVEVTLADVKAGGVKKPGTCAMARAICKNPEFSEARVHLTRTYVREKGAKEWQRFETDPHLRQEIIVFDRKGDFHPGTFTLKRPRPTVTKSGSETNRNNSRKKKGPKETRSYVVAGVRPSAMSEFDPSGK